MAGKEINSTSHPEQADQNDTQRQKLTDTLQNFATKIEGSYYGWPTRVAYVQGSHFSEALEVVATSLDFIHKTYRSAGVIVPIKARGDASYDPVITIRYTKDHCLAMFALDHTVAQTETGQMELKDAVERTRLLLEDDAISRQIHDPESEYAERTISVKFTESKKRQTEAEDSVDIGGDLQIVDAVVTGSSEKKENPFDVIAGAKPRMYAALETKIIPLVDEINDWPHPYRSAVRIAGNAVGLDEADVDKLSIFLREKKVVEVVDLAKAGEKIHRWGVSKESFLGIGAVARMVSLYRRGNPSSIPWKGEHYGDGIVTKTIDRLGESELAKMGLLKDPVTESDYQNSNSSGENTSRDSITSIIQSNIPLGIQPDPGLVKAANEFMPLSFTREELQKVYLSLHGEGKVDMFLRDRIIIASRLYTGIGRPSTEFYDDPKNYKKAAEKILADFIQKKTEEQKDQ